MNLDELITIEEGREFLSVLVKFGRRFPDAGSRSEALAAMGVDEKFLDRLDANGDPGRFARILLSKLKFEPSDSQPGYHPLAMILSDFDFSPQEYELNDKETGVCRHLLSKTRAILTIRTARAAVCRIEKPGGEPVGTGVHLGRGIVLTCDHVFMGAELEDIRFRFGYYNEQRFFKTWNVFEPEPGFLSRGESPDYALVRLKEPPWPPGVKLFKGELTSTGPGAVIRMMHHPEGRPLEITEDGSIRLAADDFFCHNLPGKKQSSGSPVFNTAWELAGVHRGEDFGRDCGDGLLEAVPVPAIIDIIKDHLPV